MQCIECSLFVHVHTLTLCVEQVYIYLYIGITYIEWQNAKCIMFLNIARGTELVKRALSHPETDGRDGVTYVHGQNAKCIMFLNVPRSTKLVKRALSHPEIYCINWFVAAIPGSSSAKDPRIYRE